MIGLVVHLLVADSDEEAIRIATPFARVEETRVTYPGGAGQGSDTQTSLPFND